MQKDKITLEVTLAPFWKRLIAWVYDLLGAVAIFILALVVGYLFIYMITLPWSSSGESLANTLNSNPLWLIYLTGCVQYYYCWCWVKGGQTVGMKTWRLKLCKADGSHLCWKEAYYRSFLSLGGLANIACLFNSNKQGWHDMLCNSQVVVLPKNTSRHNQPLI